MRVMRMRRTMTMSTASVGTATMQPEPAEQLADDEHRHDRQHRRQVDLLRHHERRDDVPLDQVHDDAEPTTSSA